MKIVHISDTHGPRGHSKLIIPECDVLLHTGDIGGRTNQAELVEFLSWFEKQPAKKKIFIAGNHDICLDKIFCSKNTGNTTLDFIRKQDHEDSIRYLEQYNVVYLNDSEYVFNGVKFYGSPYTPSFHRQNWAFNADRGDEIKLIWNKIPPDVNVLLTHGPCHGILDMVIGETNNLGCQDLLNSINNIKPNIHCCGHIHSARGYFTNGKTHFFNGSVLDEDYKLTYKPILFEFDFDKNEMINLDI